MQKKPIIIVCIAVVVLAVVLLVIYLAKGGSTDPKEIMKSNKTGTSAELTFSYYPTEETDRSVTIYIEAKPKNNDQIQSIKLPDGKIVGYEPDKTYTVSQNGEYTFSVITVNGAETTKSITISNIVRVSADDPYIPEGFSHVEGTEVDTGFVIKDSAGNEYVWVPVKSGKMTRAVNEQYIEDDPTSNGLYNSVATYYGFYIARYEASRENVNGLTIARSVKGAIPWTNIVYQDAYVASKNIVDAYDYKDVSTALINSYAWDTTLEWLNGTKVNYSTNTSLGNYSGTILGCGATSTDEVNNICDMAGNVREWTTETYDAQIQEEVQDNNNNKNNTTEETTLLYKVIRGGSANISKIANSRIGEREDLADAYWGFRVVLYK